MVIVEILGGLGNQLSAYACGYSVAKYLGQELVLDVSDYTHKGYFRPYCLDKLQIVSHQKLIYPPASAGFMDADCIPKELRDRNLAIIKHEDYKTREELLAAVKGKENVYLMGYGGIQYCTPEERIELKRQFQLKTPSAAVEQFKKKVQREYSVAVHIRRTDFVSLGMNTSVEYYRAAITYVKLFHPDAYFYFFSDDIQYAKDQFGPGGNYHYVHLLGGMNADLDEFFCMSACNGRILAKQSTFSFWANELSWSENQINLCPQADGKPHTENGLIYLNQAAVYTLSGQYRTTGGVPAKIVSVNDAVYRLIMEDRNGEAIDMIERACLDSYWMSEADTQELAVFKTIALAQTGEAGLPSALHTFYWQMQTENRNPAFHANYFRALYQSGYAEESAIHAALANHFGDQEGYQEYFAQMEQPFVQKLYQLLRNRTARHFIFIPIEGWSYYITYVKTLAVYLARMGQKVTFFQPAGPIEGTAGGAAVAQYLLKHIGGADGVYQYHIDLLSNPAGIGNALRSELIRQCAGRFDMPAVVAASHPNVFAGPKVPGIKYVVPDICDPLNRERFILEASGVRIEDYVFYMANNADAIFLSGPVLDSARERFGDKVRRAHPSWTSSACQILDTELDFTPNYISSEQLIQNAAALLDI